MKTGIVGVPEPEAPLEPEFEPEPASELEPESDPLSTTTVPMRRTIPGVARLFGSVILARSPTLMLSAWEGSKSISTRRAVEVASAIGAPGVAGLPRVAETLLIRSGPGRT